MNRTPLLTFAGVGAGFSVESWFLPIDGPVECVTRVALIFDDGDDNAKVALLGPGAVRQLIDVLTDFATPEGSDGK